MSDAPGLILYVAIAVVTMLSTAFASIWTWKTLRRWGVRVVPASAITVVAVLLATGGLWLLFDLAWIGAALARLGAPLIRSPGRRGH